ncbi:hypothetical protein CHLRE_19g750647v5 [Chlamydomonas reinhardtii]|uniref:Protein kinase domain-containing protein n=1 Tax=Chlamydomonas reinhardtii TaxID=3055 RepID=A0A2K3CNE2_CHLRE|nr:uncharacterized protein CHLRE_19g750647v5 [Chlamydomonas reinhardtii]PNW69801.1 hypothetical protein CHLRE_19g750647v5 [Chlamydomonas reinhardtii]
MILRACFQGAFGAGKLDAEETSQRARPSSSSACSKWRRSELPSVPLAAPLHTDGVGASAPTRHLSTDEAAGLRSQPAVDETGVAIARARSPAASAAADADALPTSPPAGPSLSAAAPAGPPPPAPSTAAPMAGGEFGMAPLDSARRSESSASSDGGGSPPAGISFIARKDDGGGPARPPTAPGPPHGVVASRNLAGTSSAGEPSGEHRATDDGGGGGGGEGSGSGGSSRPGRQGKHASRYKKLTPSEVSECAPHEILDGIGLSLQRLGRGSFGIVMSGAYSGLRCAVKIMVTEQLDKSALRELLLAPAINHANLVQTFTSRCARLTHEFFDLLEGVGVGVQGGGSSRAPVHDRSRPRVLQPIPLQSGDGFGDPGCSVATASDPYRVLHVVLHDFIAKTDQFLIVIVQELCNKGTLHAAIRAGVFRPNAANPSWNLRLARRALLRTALEMARGLLHLHDTGLVHGDFKPQNVLLDSSRDDRRGFSAKVADFGLSHVLPQHASSVATDSFGSPAYMAPEAFSGKASKATDVYSFGVCLWELLCGRTPYSDVREVRDLVAELAAGRAPALVWPDGAEMSDGIIALGRRCMSPRPEDRPDFKEVVEELIQVERMIRAELLAPAVAAQAAAAAAVAASAPTSIS